VLLFRSHNVSFTNNKATQAHKRQKRLKALCDALILSVIQFVILFINVIGEGKTESKVQLHKAIDANKPPFTGASL